MQVIFDKLAENMQLIYRKAIDADNTLNALQKDGKGKFSNIFNSNEGFRVSSKRFMPYVEELSNDIAELSQKDDATIQAALPSVVQKLELLMKTLNQFQQSLRTKA
ncbi:hypothetical protein OE749_02565 [Aestuariibacter sp. AA17]|uniref:Prephenate dehydrogenase n=1 Tax=Fluctibacter corallii TaxID=2984329 RepID=A0ABT3A4G6_9ALTE|nr:hypothetical protein [Aestuariibacter sp. AA17]MCV2883581.1 hypothetical protein [Aestuariibacter sp. AA17]